jgi:hypothetical protein
MSWFSRGLKNCSVDADVTVVVEIGFTNLLCIDSDWRIGR